MKFRMSLEASSRNREIILEELISDKPVGRI